jgi:hypothetical protein
MAMAKSILSAALAASVFAIAEPAMAQAGKEPPRPDYDELMTAMCETPTEDRSCILEGKRLTYWLSFDSAVGGRRLYTAVATAQNEAKPSEAQDFAPGTKLSLAQVTYALEGGAWKLLARQIDFGGVYSSGAAGNPPMDDDGVPLFRQAIGDGVLIGYPTLAMANEGISVHAYSMFRSAPDKSGRWIYAGDIVTGSDNGAGCDPKDEPRSCYSSIGTLSLTGRTKGGWPEVKTDPTGSLYDLRSGKVRGATAADASVWNFDAAQSAYVDPKRR